jgi:hypothetical protein
MAQSGRSTLLQLFRVLLPSWKFFDDVPEVPELWISFSKDPLTWRKVIPDVVSRSWHHLFLNQKECERFACYSILNQMVWDLENGSFPSSVSAELCEKLVLQRIEKNGWQDEVGKSGTFRFRLTLNGTPFFESSLKGAP